MSGLVDPSTKRKSRRGNGEGTISKAKDGRYVARISTGYVGGVRQRKAVYGKTRAEVARKLTDILKIQKEGGPVPNDRRRMRDLFDDWMKNHVEKTLRPKTVRSYRLETRKHLEPGLGHLVVSKLTPGDVDSFLEAKENEGMPSRHRAYLRAVLRSAWRYALNRQYVTVDVIKFAAAPTVRRARTMAFTVGDAHAFLAAVEPHRLRALFAVGFALGLRFGEVLGLRWSRIDLQKGEALIDAQLQELRPDEVNAHVIEHLVGGYYLLPPKSDTSNRKLKLPDVVVKALTAHRRRQQQERLKAGSEWKDFGLVFTTANGMPCSASNVRRTYKAFLKMAGLDARRFHDVRHAAATLLLAQGVPPRVVQELLGHSDIRLTLETYGHVLESQTGAAATAMDAILHRG